MINASSISTRFSYKLFAPAAILMAAGSTAEASVSPKADVLFDIFGLPVTNSIATSWVVSLILVIGLRILVGRPKLVPTKGQAVIEGMINWVRNDIVGPIVGKKALGATLPVVLGLFFYILIQNWSGLIPGVGSIGYGHTDEAGKFHVVQSLIRPANADWNGTIALAIVAMAAWLFIILKYAGPKLIIKDLFGNKADKKEVGVGMFYGLSVIFFLVGFIEIFSILLRPFTLSVRLFGNIYGGENLLHATYFTPPFYFLELLVGFVQAFVFVLLLSVYIGLITNHGDEEHH